MPICDRFASEFLPDIEADGTVAPHVVGCADCEGAYRRYLTLAEGLRATRPPRGPAPHWKRDILMAIAAEQREATHRSPWIVPLVIGLAAVAAVAVLVRRPGRERPQELPQTLAIDWSLAREGNVVRGGSDHASDFAAVGDTLVIEGKTGGAREVELRLFRRDGGLVLRCPVDPICVVESDRIRARFLLSSPGRYEVVIATANAPLPAPRADLPADTEALAAAGAAIRIGRPIRVR